MHFKAGSDIWKREVVGTVRAESAEGGYGVYDGVDY